jgi:uncharacterized protein involved in exopolysaccharide biosynthesis
MSSGFGGSIGSAFGLKNPNDLYVGILKGHTIADHLIQRFDLRALYEQNTLMETRKALQSVTNVSAGRDGLIVIEVDDTDPKRAAEISNAYVEELDKLTQQLAISEAAQRRLFFDRQLKTAREKLAQAEVALRGTQEKTGLIQLDGQAKAIFDIYTEMRARIAAKEVELASLRTFATEQNPDVMRAAQELASLRSEASKLEKARERRRDGDILVPTGNVAEAGVEFGRRVRELKYSETLFELLAKQFEIAKIDEAKDAIIIQVVDRAISPDHKSKPKRFLITAIAGVVSFLLTAVLALGFGASERPIVGPDSVDKPAGVFGHVTWR